MDFAHIAGLSKQLIADLFHDGMKQIGQGQFVMRARKLPKYETPMPKFVGRRIRAIALKMHPQIGKYRTNGKD